MGKPRVWLAAALVLSLSVVAMTLGAAPAQAQASNSNFREAGQRFQRGVTLYGEADYHAALVEFKRAYLLAPNAAVLYNIGETQYQLQDYAAALTTFQRYLAESSPNASHRTEVESSVEVLRARVGHLTVVTEPPGADITLDDQPLGKTPFDKPLLVSIGHRKVIASLPGRPPITRYVDVATDDNASVTLAVPPPTDGTAGILHPAPPPKRAESSGSGAGWRIAGWVATGLFVGGAIVFGVLANQEASTLSKDRASYPVTASTLSHDASLTTTYSVVSDCLTAAAIVVGGITLYSSVASLSSTPSTTGSREGAIRVSLGLASAHLDMSF